MFISKITTTLKEPYDSNWKILADTYLGQEVHPERRVGFYLSREALRECFSELGIDLSVLDLSIKKYCSLVQYPDFTFSLSHTSGRGAAILGRKDEYQGLGIDVEKSDRKVSDLVLKRISNPNDLPQLPLERWVIKEAIYKAIMNTGRFEDPVGFAKLLIDKDKWLHELLGISGEWKTMLFDDHLVAVAWIKS